jgi:Raf kinase inhibitor-like YbhB/YbcL family protein
MKLPGYSFSVSFLALALLMLACTPAQTPAPVPPAAGGSQTKASPVTRESNATIVLASPAFQDGGQIPVKYTCQGQGLSPALNWGQSPQNTKSLVLIVEDLDGPRGILTHWIVFNIPPGMSGLPEAVPDQSHSSSPFMQGNNSFGKAEYRGPCPPGGQSHRYRFSLYALDTMLSDLTTGVTREQIQGAMQGHIVSSGTLTGLYN